MRDWFLALLIVVTSPTPALAHKLRVFASVEGETISGYGFFVGGGRPQGSTVIIKDRAAREVYRGSTDSNGHFSFTPAAPSDFTIVIDTREGHVSETMLTADRFGASAPKPDPAPHTPPGAARPSSAGGADADAERRIEAAVARQVRPLLERIEALDSRLRVADAVAGVCLILGLAGIGLWAIGRKSADTRPPET